MRSFEAWMDEYGESHQNPTNQVIHKICVPLIVFSLLGMFWAIPTPAVFSRVPYLNFATLFMVLCLGFYLSLNFKMFVGMLLMSAAFGVGLVYLAATPYLLVTSIAIFVVSWAGQFYGHKLEGKKPSFFKDLLFLLIGPLWVLRFLYRSMGIMA
ncbi:MAG: DUF962 domain-containing protein [Myxococcales bacterium]|nr:DUF962 domain-containing protein [Myxococcales bacterium]MCB9644741.1 DUF962 domain-containing protein [Myxococcales bacterium]